MSGMLLGSHTKIGYLCIHVCVQQHVLWFQVSVDNHVSVAIIHCRENLLEKASSFCLFNLQMQGEIVLKVGLRAELAREGLT